MEKQHTQQHGLLYIAVFNVRNVTTQLVVNAAVNRHNGAQKSAVGLGFLG